MHIPGEVDSFPDIARLPLETEEGLIGGTPSLLGVEPDFGPLLVAIDRQDLGIQVEEDGGEGSGLHEKMTSPSIVEISEGGEAPGAEALQKSPQGGGVGIGGKAGQILEDTVLLQEEVGLDPSQSEEDRIENRQDRIADGIPMVALVEANGASQGTAKFHFLEKLLQKVQPTEVGQHVVFEGDFDISMAFSHYNYTQPLVR